MIRGIRAFSLFCVAFVLVFVVLRWGGFLRVREVVVFPTRYVAVEKLTGEIIGANILRLDLRPLCQAISADPRVLRVEVRVSFFLGRVKVEVRERSPAVAVRLTTGETVWVDREGVILAPAERGEVVAKAIGARVREEVVEAALSWERLPRALRERFSFLDLSGEEAVAPGHPTVLFGEICQVPNKLGILTELWQEGLVEGYEVVDLRHAGMVILKRGE